MQLEATALQMLLTIEMLANKILDVMVAREFQELDHKVTEWVATWNTQKGVLLVGYMERNDSTRNQYY